MKKAGRQELRISFPAFLLSSFSPSSCLFLNPSADFHRGDDVRATGKMDEVQLPEQVGSHVKHGNQGASSICAHLRNLWFPSGENIHAIPQINPRIHRALMSS